MLRGQRRCASGSSSAEQSSDAPTLSCCHCRPAGPCGHDSGPDGQAGQVGLRRILTTLCPPSYMAWPWRAALATSAVLPSGYCGGSSRHRLSCGVDHCNWRCMQLKLGSGGSNAQLVGSWLGLHSLTRHQHLRMFSSPPPLQKRVHTSFGPHLDQRHSFALTLVDVDLLHLTVCREDLASSGAAQRRGNEPRARGKTVRGVCLKGPE